VILAAALAVAVIGDDASAQTGVSDDRVSLPSGPGSLEGLGENVGVNANMGTMSWSVPINAPAGFPGMTPALDLSYSSGGGGSVVGMGWSLDMPSVERMTYRGLPRYARDDDFAVGGSGQLVHVAGTDPPVYRARYEGGFVRWTWLDAGDGTEGYWRAEYPDGRVGFFGARADGTLVPEARVGFDGGTFKYMLVELVDVHDHRLVYTWAKFGNVALVQHIGWVFMDGNPRYAATFAYEERRDETGFGYLSDAKGGFDALLTQRLKTINILSGSERIRRYDLSYEAYADSGGFTRLSRVEQRGHEDGLYPIVFDFTYSKALGGLCDGVDCQRPFLVDMGTVGVDLGNHRATLLDLNGDALPDLVHTPLDGNHRIFFNASDGAGASAFDPTPVESAVGTSGFVLGSGRSQVLDVDGDGFVDLLNTKNGEYLRNDGSGDWAEIVSVVGSEGEELPDFESDFDPGDEDGLVSIRFIDYDNDKKIDVMRGTAVATTYYRNVGAGGFQTDPGGVDLGAGFEEANLELADMNGDGLLDVVQILEGQLKVKLSYGWGRWAPEWRVISNLPITLANKSLVSLQDINGDALSDLVIVAGEQVTYALNRNAEVFQGQQTLTSSHVDGGAIPNRLNETTVLFADMNGNGSADVVWVTPGGQVTYLELFPVRPNLLSRVENGLGAVTDVTYGTSVEHMAADGGADAWPHRLPHPMIVVDGLDRWDRLTNVHEITRYRYHDGYYDGLEKQFRGYGRVETELVSDDSQEGGLTIATYDVGAADPYRHGRLLGTESWSADRALSQSETTWEDCPLDGVDGATPFPARYVCATATRTVIKEGTAEDRWVTVEAAMDHDGYGNVTLSSSLGVTAIGGGACEPCDRDASVFGAPCGDGCLGDERFVETAYVSPDDTNGRWILHAPYQVREYGRDGDALVSETQTFYDGEAFVGLPLGQLDEGLVSRVTTKVDDAGKTLQIDRSAHDAHGNVVETLDPLGAPNGTTHRRQFAYDAEHLRVVQTDVFLEDPDGAPYTLRREVQYEPLFDQPVESTSWMRVVGGEVKSPRRSSYYGYDEFGRVTSLVRPGVDTLESPTETYAYDLGAPSSRVVLKKRSAIGGPLDLESIRCLDGRGRTYQIRTRVAPDRYQVTGFTRFNPRSAPVETFQPYVGDGGACDGAPPDGVLSTTTRYDAAHRPIETTLPDDGVYGTVSVRRQVYEPLTTWTWDEEDTDPSSPHADTPLATRQDGLGRTVAYDRYLSQAHFERTRVQFDALGRVRGYVDPGGHAKVQTFDLAGRLLRVDDPNAAGPTTFTWDDASNLVAARDGRGTEMASRFDGMNRQVAVWDPADPDATEVTWRYDTAPGCDAAECTNLEGQLATVSYPLAGLDGARGQDASGYDTRGRPVFSARTLAGVRFESRATYDNADRRVSTTLPDDRTIATTYDDAGRATAIPGFVTQIGYDDRNQLAALAYDNGVATSYAFDDVMRLAGATVTGADGALQGFGYTRDRVGNLLGVEDTVRSGRVPAADATFGYDAWYRVTTAELAGETVTTAFDALDNVVSVTSSHPDSGLLTGVFTYGSAAPNAVTEVAGRAMAYDAAGHMTTRGDAVLSWDYQGRLVSASRGGAEVGRFVYGATNERVMKVEDGSVTHYLAPDFELRDGITTHYVRVGRVRVARIETADLATRVLADVAPAAGPDGEINAGDAWAAWSAGSDPTGHLWSSARRMLVETGDEVTFLSGDHLGSLTLATDEAGAVVGQRAYYASGADRGPAFGWVDPRGFTAQERDASTGLLHFAHRYLDTDTGRWASIDPLFQQASAANLASLGESTTAYAYVANNWENTVDPTGLKGARVRPTSKGGQIGGPRIGGHRWATRGAKARGQQAQRGAARAQRAQRTQNHQIVRGGPRAGHGRVNQLRREARSQQKARPRTESGAPGTASFKIPRPGQQSGHLVGHTRAGTYENINHPNATNEHGVYDRVPNTNGAYERIPTSHYEEIPVFHQPPGRVQVSPYREFHGFDRGFQYSKPGVYENIPRVQSGNGALYNTL